MRSKRESSDGEVHDPEVLGSETQTDMGLESSNISSVEDAESRAIVDTSSSDTTRWGLASSVLGGRQGQGTLLLSIAASVGGLFGTSVDFSGPTSVLAAVGVLAAIVAVHEAGHFTAARIQGIHVTKFAIGFGPALFKYQGPEVEYSFRAIPLGGYVGFPDDDPESPFPPDDPNLLRNKNIPARALVISAGIIANIIFAYAVLLTQVTTVGIPSQIFRPGVMVPEVLHKGVAERSGLRSGDLITYVAGNRLVASPYAVNEFVNVIKDNPGREVVVRFERNGEAFELPVVPELSPSDNFGQIGVKLAPNAVIRHRTAQSPMEAINLSSVEFQKLANQVTGGLKQLFTNFNQVKNQVSGPVAIVAVGAEVARVDSAGLFQFAAIVSINLAVVNALPLPALDGGYMFLLLIEAIRQEKMDKELEGTIMGTGLLLLTGVGVFMILRDVVHLVGG